MVLAKFPQQADQELTHSQSEVASNEYSPERSPGLSSKNPLAALHSPLAAVQRRQVVQNLSQHYGNRQLQRLIHSIHDQPAHNTGGLKLSGVRPDENVGGYTETSPEDSAVERVCECGGSCAKCSGSSDEAQAAADQGGLAANGPKSRVRSFMDGIFSGAIGGLTVQRTIGDGHDLASPRFSGDPVLEACFDNEQTLRQGSNGPAVQKIQAALLELGFPMPKSGADGIFGSETKRTLRTFQRNALINEAGRDGVVGPVTMTRLDERFGTATPAAAGAVTVSENVVTPATHSPAGQFNFQVGWNTNGRDGFIVQELTNTMNVQRCDGSNVANTGIDPHYWEAWRVNSSGQSRPNLGAVNDIWFRTRRPNTQGNWTMDANVFFVSSLDAAAKFTTGAVGNAGDLQSTTTAPSNLGSSLLTRHAGGVWDNCNGNNTHTPA